MVKIDCYNTTGATASGGSGCVLALTGDGPMGYLGVALLGVSAVLLGIMFLQIGLRGTRIPGLRRLFPKGGSTPPVSPRD